MDELDKLRSSLVAYIVKQGRVTHQDLLKWASSNRIGYLTLYLVLNDIIKDRRWRAGGEYVIASFKVNGEELKLVIPTSIEASSKPVKSTRVERERKQRRSRSANILEIVRSDEQETTKATQESEATGPAVQEVPREGGVEEAGKPSLGAEGVGAQYVVSAEDVAKVDVTNMEVNTFMEVLRSAINQEFIGNTDLAYKVAIAMLNYLGKYWSVGELRLKIDVAKQVVGRVDEGIVRIEDGVLRILRRMGIIEVVEPGVVNRVKELPRDFVKVRLDFILDSNKQS
ncbi:hypothetical protein [Vulcanisaeta thermophila]|uniref:hypothetical protein n=1 Tax=Vulcanisaeta thermophila TaxID=867917 RepID=UPI0008533D71|nr:hypothetical protein [Vulcanisaeta thermophila]